MNVQRSLHVLVWSLLLAAFVAAGAEDEPLARVNGQAVSRAAYLQGLEERHGYEFAEAAILNALILQAAEKAGLTPTAAELDAELTRFVKDNFAGSDERYRAWLREFRHTEAGVKAEVLVQVAQFKLRSRGLKADDTVLRKHFDEHLEQYDRPERVAFRQILIPTVGRPVDDQYPESRKLALDVLRQLREGLRFEDAVVKYSEDPNRERTAGRVGPVPVERLRAQSATLLKALSGVKDGEVVPEPVLYIRQYYLLQRVFWQPAQKADFDKLKPALERDWLAAAMPGQEAFLSELLKGAKVEGRSGPLKDTPLSGRWSSPSGLPLSGWLHDAR